MLDVTDKRLLASFAEAILQEPTAKEEKKKGIKIKAREGQILRYYSS